MSRGLARRVLAGMLAIGTAISLGAPPQGPVFLDSATSAATRRVTIGRSVNGQRIRAIRGGDVGSQRSVLVVGCIHGNECAGRRIIRRLRNMPPPDNLEIWIVWTLNPDGMNARTRQNARGVDLNRNFGRRWRRIGSRWSTYYSGPRKWSEPESRAARSFILDERPDLTIWYHQAMALVVKTGRHVAVKRRYARLVGLPLRRLDPLPGTATRWQNHRFPNKPAFVVELPGGPMTRASARRHARAVVEVARSR